MKCFLASCCISFFCITTIAQYANLQGRFEKIKFEHLSQHKEINTRTATISTWSSDIPDSTEIVPLETPEERILKNNISASIYYFVVMASACIDYERLTIYNPKALFSSYWTRLSYGGYNMMGNKGNFCNISINTLLGRKNNHLELGIGGQVVVNKPNNWVNTRKFDFYPVANLAYRFRNTKQNFVFRAGLETFELYYIMPFVSFGFSL